METQGTSKPALENQKSAKRIRMIEEAYNLFVSKGVHATAIDEVVKKAGVAKGTFYLYFHDKYDLLDQIVLYKSTDARPCGPAGAWRKIIKLSSLSWKRAFIFFRLPAHRFS